MTSKFLILIILPMHLFLIYSIFDIYFTSPIIQNIPVGRITHKPLAKRLVLFVADGLRANKLFFNEMTDVPYLKNLIKNGSSWGLSYTRVPTETRPGHVALIAGFYEDMSSITKGWQENAVEFDSLFNRSSKTWSWGSPDVLPMFQKGAVKDKVNIFCYSPDMEDFAGNRTWELDTWVFDRVKTFLKDVKPLSTLDKELREDGVVLFLHLLGIDVSGHAQKPHSKHYTENMRIVSEGIGNVTTMINEFYNDKKTAFIMTSDHGMTDWGSHGAGSNDETITPVIAWGSGIYTSRNAEIKLTATHSSAYQFQNFKIDTTMQDSLQGDVWQADLCALMSSILGIPIPVNSVGVVPINYLDANDSVKADIMRTNILQLFIQYETKYEMKRSSSVFHFEEYNEFPMKMAHEELSRGLRLTSKGKYKDAIQLYQQISKLLLDGISYYHKYDRFWLGFLTSSTFILWIIYLATFIVNVTDMNENIFCKRKHILMLSITFISFFIYIHLQRLPYSYLLYQVIPTTMLWYMSIFRRERIYCIFKVAKDNCIFVIEIILLMESLVWSFFYRQVLSFGIILTFLIIITNSYHVIDIKLRIRWTIVCISLMIYPYLPVIGGYNSYALVAMGSFLNIILTMYLFGYKEQSMAMNIKNLSVKVFMAVMMLMTFLHVLYCQMKIESGEGLSTKSQMFNWITFLSLLPIICFTSQNNFERFELLQVAIMIIYNLMSIYYELIFMFNLVLFAITWRDIELKYRMHNSSSAVIDRRKVIQTSIFIFLLTFSFFATGNVASINSFDVASTYSFVTVFRPFVMGTILMSKIILPMLVISLTYVFIQHYQDQNIHSSPYSLKIKERLINIEEICLVTMLADFAALHFLFMIRDEGSWKDIGTSISHYLIAMGISIIAFLFTVLSKYLLTVNQLRSDLDRIKMK